MTQRQPRGSSKLVPVLLCASLALAAALPLLLHGPSCGHDYEFHVQSWMDASQQLRQGLFLPHWAFSPAFNAGEPRFLFYPPISWLFGSFLLLLLPSAAVTTAYTVVALTGAALAMYALAVRFTSRGGAVLAAAFYIGNPYVFFTAFERTAFAELLAAAWMPLLLRAVLAEQISALAVAVPLALLWLTNAPAAVMGTYTFVLVVLIRLGRAWLGRRTVRAPEPGMTLGRSRDEGPMLGQAFAGLVLGLALPAFYLLPAAFERRYVQIAMAIIPNMRVEDNFLFGGTGNGPHDRVLHTASLVAVEVCGLTAAALFLAFLHQRTSLASSNRSARATLIIALAVAVLLSALLWPITLPLWHLLPELAFLQFPWRLLAVLGCLLGLGIALALSRRELPLAWAAMAAIALVSTGALTAYSPLHQVCEANELPAERAALFRTHHGVGPTDEYTPITADNDELRWHDPAFWLGEQPNAPAPGTVPNPAATNPGYDALPPLAETISGRAPMHLRLKLEQPQDLILNLRDYPAWAISVNGGTHPKRLERDDGLLAVALPAGVSTLDIHWQTLPDMWAGDALSLMALGAAGWLRLRSRKIGS